MNGDHPGLESRVAVLESDVRHIRSDIADIKTDVRRLDEKVGKLGARMDDKFEKMLERMDGLREDFQNESRSIRIAIAKACIWAVLLYVGLGTGLLAVMGRGFGWLE